MDKKRNKAVQFRLIVVSVVWLIPTIIFLSIYLFSPQDIIITAESKEEASVEVSVTVEPDNPIGEVGKIKKVVDSTEVSFSDVEIATKIPLIEGRIAGEEKIVNSLDIFFSGKSKYPGSSVVLEFPEEEIYVNVESDIFGNWLWKNNQVIFTPGVYEIIVYNFNQIGVAENNEVFVEQHEFRISEEANHSSTIILNLNDETIEKVSSLNAVESHFFDKFHPIFIISMNFLDELASYDPGSEMTIRYDVKSSQAAENYDAIIEHQLYYESDGRYFKLDEFREEFSLHAGTFEKVLSLQSDANPITYLLNTTILVNNNTYLQSQKFKIINPDNVLTVANTTSYVRGGRAILWNFLIGIIVLNIILTFIIFEYSRMFIHSEVSEDNLKEEGYF